MKILYLSQKPILLNENSIFSDLINQLVLRGHKITLCQANVLESFYKGESLSILDIKVENQFGVNFIKKGLILLSLQSKFKRGIKKYLINDKFDLVLYATPPITFAKVVNYVKKKYQCMSFLMLKDIFPQNALDIGILNKKGLKVIIYYYFKRLEKKLYKYSDKIGCMSKGNLQYIIENEKDINVDKLNIFPNSIKIDNNKKLLLESSKVDFKNKYSLNNDTTIFILGGNLGKPQGLHILAKVINNLKDYNNAFFIIVGKGTEKENLKNDLITCNNAIVLDILPNDEYKKVMASCDVGMIFLDPRFTIPNYPSRILSYMEYEMPILACTDKVSDIKDLVEKEAECGKWSFSGDVESIIDNIKWFSNNKDERIKMGIKGREYLEKNFNVKDSVMKLENAIKELKDV